MAAGWGRSGRPPAARPPAKVLWGLGLVLGVGALVIHRSGTTNLPAKPPAGYLVLARLLADDLDADPTRPRPAPDLDRVRAEDRVALAELARLAPGDPEVDALAIRARAAIKDGLASLDRLEALPKPPGAGALFAEGFARGYVGDVLGVVGRVLDLRGRQTELEAEVHRLFSAVRRVQATTLELPRLAARFADAAGRVARDVHFVPEWPAGGPISARYAPAGDLSDEAADLQQTVPGVEGVVVSAWADELRCEGLAHAYAGPERDRDVSRCLEAMRVAAEYRPFAPGLLWNTERGLRVRLKGHKHLDHPAIAARFRRGGSEVALSWDFEGWDEGESKVLDGEGRLPWDPEGWELVVSFPGTAATFRADWPPASR